MRSRLIAFLPVCAFFLLAWKSVSAERELLKVGKVIVYEDTLSHILHFTSGMNIDADGSPRAYHPVSDSGLDHLAYAGHDGNWWGIVTVKGKPVVQGKDDPAPGFYVSTTSLQDASKKLIDPARYVNSETIPYFVLPNDKTILSRVHTGDIAFVKNLRNGQSSYAIFADVGPKNKIGEGSIRLAEKLGINANPRTGGVQDSVYYEIFPGSGRNAPLTEAAIDSIGTSLRETSNPR